MSTIGLIIQREYWTRVRKRSFLIMTLLGPLFFAGIIIVPAWLGARDSDDEKIIAVIDESGLLGEKLAAASEGNNFRYEHVQLSLNEAKADIPKSNRYGLLYIPDINVSDPQGINFFSEGSPSISVQRNVEQAVKRQLRDIKLERSSISRETLDMLEADVDINTINLTEGGSEQEGSAGVASAVGYVSAFLIYMFIFLYGAQVMRGVIEEKTSRIVEVIISSVRPFQLMMGKIIGVASVGLTQFMLWVLFTLVIAGVGLSFFSEDISTTSPEAVAEQMTEEQAAQVETVTNVLDAINTVNIPLIIGCFVFYFLGGYLLYSALFAAVGSAADSDTDTQQFMLPVSAPLVLSMVMLAAVLKEPDGTLAFWMSMIPFTSPVTMMMRLPFGVPTWELLLSMALLVLGFVFTTWVAAKIYRIGILTYGSKVNYKTISKWLFS